MALLLVPVVGPRLGGAFLRGPSSHCRAALASCVMPLRDRFWAATRTVSSSAVVKDNLHPLSKVPRAAVADTHRLLVVGKGLGIHLSAWQTNA